MTGCTSRKSRSSSSGLDWSTWPARLSGRRRRILARLEHPNIARLIDGGVTSGIAGGVMGRGTPYLVMEYVDGLPIDEAVQGKTLHERVKLFVKAADAVQFAHARLVVHADLKPSNIFVDGQGRVKLLDFGIARLMEGEGEHTHGALPMTAAYASPARRPGRRRPLPTMSMRSASSSLASPMRLAMMTCAPLPPRRGMRTKRSATAASPP